MTQFAFSFDVSRCSACLACVVACQDQNDLIVENIAFRQVTIHEEGELSSVKISSLSLACCHCGDAPCVKACPTNAIFKQDDTGVVDINRDICIGCHCCELACPFGATKFAEDGKMAKCNLCHSRLTNNLEPACVKVCSTKALKAGPLEELTKQKTEKASVIILKSLITTQNK